MKRIAFLTYSLAPGGAEKQVSILLNYFSKFYQIYLVLMNDTIFYEIPENIKIYYLENSNPFENGIKKLIKLPLLAYKYAEFCKKNKIEKSISFMTRPNYINALSKKFGNNSKIIINERAMPSLQHKKGSQGRINEILIKKLYKFADIILTNSKGNKYDLEKNFYLNVDKYIYNLIEIEKIKMLEKEKTNCDSEKFTFITVGRIDEGKNHELLIKSLKKLDLSAKLIIIGEGELKQKLKKLAERYDLKDKIFFIGKHKNPYKFLSKADCFVFSSNYEGFPNVLLEALACELPIISTDCKSGPREILSPYTDFRYQTKDIEFAEYGILVPVGDVDKMAKAMEIMYKNRKLIEKYKKNALKRAKDFDIDRIIKDWEKVL